MLTTRILQLILYMPVISIASAIPSYPQEPAEPQVAMLVTWHGTGGITLPTSPAWKLNFITAYDNAGRPVASFKNETTPSTAAKQVSIATSASTGGGTFDTIILASQSGSGTCWYYRHVSTAGLAISGTSYATTGSGTACQAGNAPTVAADCIAL